MKRYTPILIAVAAMLAIALSLTITDTIHNYAHQNDTGPGTQRSPLTTAPAYTFDGLLDAIEWVESKGDPWAVGDGGDAVGAYQIHKIYVDDVNRFVRRMPLGLRRSMGAIRFRYDHAERYDKKLSRQMVTLYLKHYGGTFEEMARKHNGGPNGHKKQATEKYWLKVKARMEAVK